MDFINSHDGIRIDCRGNAGFCVVTLNVIGIRKEFITNKLNN